MVSQLSGLTSFYEFYVFCACRKAGFFILEYL